MPPATAQFADDQDRAHPSPVMVISRQTESMKLLALPASILFLAAPALSSGDKPVFLPMKKFEQVADRAHASCASVDLEFSQKFYDCMDEKMKGIYIDSSTVRSRN